MEERATMTGDLLLTGCRVYSTPAAAPAEAILLREGRVAALGDEEVCRAAAGHGVSVRNLFGATVTAGFTDAHIHPTAWALARRRVSLVGSTSPEDAVERLRLADPSPRGVLMGHGWNRNLWARDPHRFDLDRYFPETPVVLDSQDLHSAWLNTTALRLCGVDRDFQVPAGGAISRDDVSGEPAGILYDAARAVALARIPGPSPGEIAAALTDAQRELHSLGITGIHSVEPTGLRDFDAMVEAGTLRLRVLQYLPLDQLGSSSVVGPQSGAGGPWLGVGGVKMFLDGSLGSRTAWLREPYEGTRDDRGLQTLSEGEFRDAVRTAAAQGLASAVHAIGDAAVELAVEVLSTAPALDLPHRIEHLQLCPEALWRRIARAGIVASMQPAHILTDIPAAERHWGRSRSRFAYPLEGLRRAGVGLAFGSDAPVETPDPRPGLYGAIVRATWADYGAGAVPEGWNPEHRLAPAEAISAYTEGPARAAGVADHRGRLLPGFDADLVAWSSDPFQAPPDAYRRLNCLLTLVGGEIVFDRVGRG